ncbi:hypothetical protein ACIF80_25660 [Streptomyces sp. NPDC085927]|uniref:hypothetical protein n=1 Tax=Streptomyces sp. NPDC085927 TaxID=3365738 RepID=UPI0037D3C74F
MARRRFGDARSTPMAPGLLWPQVSPPVVGAGVADHSTFRRLPGHPPAGARPGTDPTARRPLGVW